MITLIVENDPDWARVITSTIERESEEMAVVGSVAQAIRFASLKPSDMFIIDARLPDGSGLELCSRLRQEYPDTPSIILSALDRPTDRVEGLLKGADDYVAMPFHPTELRVRVDAIRRRYHIWKEMANPNRHPVVSTGRLHLEFEPPAVYVDGTNAHFTPLEVRLLAQLVRYSGQVLRHDFLAEEIWGYNDQNSRSLVKGHIASIRKKIRLAGGSGEEICTVHGVGYRFSPSNN